VAGAVLVGCGGDDEGPDRTDPAAEQKIVAAVNIFHRAITEGNGERACGELTAAGREELADQFAENGENICEAISKDKPARRGKAVLPRVEPVGVEGDFAVAVIQFPGEREENLLYTLIQEDGEWRVDYPGPIPAPDMIVSGLEKGGRSSPGAGEVEAAASEQTDETDRVTDVLVIGDIALAYETMGGGPDVSAPSLYVMERGSWRPSHLSLGVP
jgi:hypothetical protein